MKDQVGSLNENGESLAALRADEPAEGEAGMSWRLRGLLVSALLLGLALRLNDLGRMGLGTDEGINAWIARRRSTTSRASWPRTRPRRSTSCS